MSTSRGSRQLLGLVFIVLLGLLGWLAIAVYDKAFTTTVPVTLRADRAGTQLKANSDVKARGVVVGTVRAVTPTARGVDVELAMRPELLDALPGNVSARLLPKTLFGQRYVSLVIPGRGAGRLAAGDVIEQDRSVRAVELEKALRDLMPVLQAVQPQKLSSALGAVSSALDGRGEQLGETLVQLNAYLEQLNPTLPQLRADISKFADTLAVYTDAGPDIIDALSELTTTSQTIAEQRSGLADLFATLTTASGDLDTFLRDNQDSIIGLSGSSRPTLELLAERSAEFPCLFAALTDLKPAVDQALGAGTNRPGLHIELTVKPPSGDPQPHPPPGGGCYPAAGTTAPSSVDPVDSGIVNSPAENRFLAELLAPAYGLSPADLPTWSSLLIGPLFRGAEVTLR